MSDVKILNRGEKFAHASVGTIRGFEGKQFAKDVMGASSCEISVGTLTEGASVPFFHSHKENDENYIVRVSTDCDRNLKCTSVEPMTYICIQAKESSLGCYTMTDAEITERESLL